MAKFLRTMNGYNAAVGVQLKIAASQTINEGDIVQINTASKLVEAAVAASTTLVGIAMESVTSGASVGASDVIMVQPLTGGIFRVPYVGTTKTTLADTDLFTVKFDLNNKTAINLDDTTGGMCQVVGYNNTAKTADVYFADASIAKVG